MNGSMKKPGKHILELLMNTKAVSLQINGVRDKLNLSDINL